MKNIAVAGFGFMGMTHTLNILKNKELKLKAIIDPDLHLLEKNLNAETGNFSTGNISPEELAELNKYSSLDECLESEDLDAVHLCVHTNLHYDLTRKALLKDKHVLLEKPFCLDIDKGQELIELAEKRGKVLMIGHVLRFMSPYVQLKKWIESEEFGKLRFLSMHRYSGIPTWGQWIDKNISTSSGGALFDLVIHDIDFASWVLGQPSVIKCNYLPGKMSNHDYVSAMWNYDGSNVNVKIEGGNTFHGKFSFQAGYMAQFEKASVHYTSLKGDTIQVSDEKSIKEISAGDPGTSYYDEIDYFAGCMKNGNRPELCLPGSSLDTIKLCYRHIME